MGDETEAVDRRRREARLRRQAAGMGLALEKSRTRDPDRMDYGCYRIVDVKTGDIISGRYPYAYSLDLESCEEALNDLECALADREAKEQSLRARGAKGPFGATPDDRPEHGAVLD